MKKKWIFLMVTLVCALVAVWVYYSYQKPRAGVGKEAAAATLTAEKLYAAFAADEAAANQKYNGKAVIVSGIVGGVTNNEDVMLIQLTAGAEAGGVNCSLNNKDIKDIPTAGDEITIKGRCTGFLMDVNLVDAVIVK